MSEEKDKGEEDPIANETPAETGRFTRRSLVDHAAIVFATAGGAGFAPIAPGTWGTAVAVPMVWALADAPLWLFALVTAIIIVFGIAAAERADGLWGTHDSGRIVIDEVAGYAVTMLPLGADHRGSFPVLMLGFIVFRALDIIKPPPVRAIDREVGGGAGVVLDDVAAGVMGAVLMFVLAHFGVLDELIDLF